MESKRIYQDSYDELIRLKKTITADSFVINSSKLDGNTKNQMIAAISKVISERSKDIEKVILGVQ